MGVMKRMAASTSTRELIRLAAAIEAREAQKEIDHDARRERLAIQWEANDVSGVSSGGCRVAGEDPPAELEAEVPAWGDELPVRAQPGWYRLGRSFYRVGSGPFAHWGFPEPAPEPARHQLRLF